MPHFYLLSKERIYFDSHHAKAKDYLEALDLVSKLSFFVVIGMPIWKELFRLESLELPGCLCMGLI